MWYSDLCDDRTDSRIKRYIDSIEFSSKTFPPGRMPGHVIDPWYQNAKNNHVSCADCAERDDRIAIFRPHQYEANQPYCPYCQQTDGCTEETFSFAIVALYLDDEARSDEERD